MIHRGKVLEGGKPVISEYNLIEGQVRDSYPILQPRLHLHSTDKRCGRQSLTPLPPQMICVSLLTVATPEPAVTPAPEEAEGSPSAAAASSVATAVPGASGAQGVAESAPAAGGRHIYLQVKGQVCLGPRAPLISHHAAVARRQCSCLQRHSDLTACGMRVDRTEASCASRSRGIVRSSIS